MKEVRNGIVIGALIACATWAMLQRYSYESVGRVPMRVNHITGSAVICDLDGYEVHCPPPTETEALDNDPPRLRYNPTTGRIEPKCVRSTAPD